MDDVETKVQYRVRMLHFTLADRPTTQHPMHDPMLNCLCVHLIQHVCQVHSFV